MEPPARVHPHHALAVYAESLAAGAHVAVFGDASLGLPEQLVELEAHVVHVWDPSPERAQALAGNSGAPIVVEPYTEFDGRVRGIGLAIVPDLGLFDDPAELIARVRDLVGVRGVALIAAANREAPAADATRAFDYYELFDLVAAGFAAVRMVAELTFQGVSFVALGDGDDAQAVSVDPQLAQGDRAPVAFVAVASQTEMPLDPYAIVELPPETSAFRGADAGSPLHDRVDDPVDVQARAEAAAAVEEARSRIEALELRLDGEAARAVDLASRLAERDGQLAAISGHADALAERSRSALAVVEALTARVDRAEAHASELQQQIGMSGEANAAELARFEEALRERARAVRDLEAEVARRERMVRELVGVIDETGAGEPVAVAPSTYLPPAEPPPPAPPPPPSAPVVPPQLVAENARLREQLDALALDLARREGEAQASQWTVAELERRLVEAAPEEAPARENDGHGDVAARLSAAQDQLDALRQALAQEHEARVRAESGEELARARAEIQRLTTLIPADADADAAPSHPIPHRTNG
jgi:hypothetical protein